MKPPQSVAAISGTLPCAVAFATEASITGAVWLPALMEMLRQALGAWETVRWRSKCREPSPRAVSPWWSHASHGRRISAVSRQCRSRTQQGKEGDEGRTAHPASRSEHEARVRPCGSLADPKRFGSAARPLSSSAARSCHRVARTARPQHQPSQASGTERRPAAGRVAAFL